MGDKNEQFKIMNFHDKISKLKEEGKTMIEAETILFGSPLKLEVTLFKFVSKRCTNFTHQTVPFD